MVTLGCPLQLRSTRVSPGGAPRRPRLPLPQIGSKVKVLIRLMASAMSAATCRATSGPKLMPVRAALCASPSSFLAPPCRCRCWRGRCSRRPRRRRLHEAAAAAGATRAVIIPPVSPSTNKPIFCSECKCFICSHCSRSCLFVPPLLLLLLLLLLLFLVPAAPTATTRTTPPTSTPQTPSTVCM
jgi:hypothetical protein